MIRWLLLGLCTLFFGIFLVLSSEMIEAQQEKDEWIGWIDHHTLHGLAQFRGPDLNSAAINMTALGSGAVLITLVILLTSFLIFIRRYRNAIHLVIASLGSALLTSGFKNHFERARPDTFLRLVDADGHSYPSGHSLSSAAIYFTVAMICCGAMSRHKDRAIILFLFSLMIIVIGSSRIYLGVHYFSDVTAGILLGIAWASFVGAAVASTVASRATAKATDRTQT